ncbi:MAG: 3'-5' exonuclease [Pirellulales bacterium]
MGKTSVTAIEEYAARNGSSLLDAARESGMNPDITKRAAVAVAKFVSLYDGLRALGDAQVEEIIGQVLSLTQYEAELRESTDADDLDRLANIQELITAAREYDEREGSDGGLEGFLEQASLTNDIDGWESDDDRATLMTLHAAKGLEFPVVFLLGVEEGILPHERSSHNNDELEEERRLLFVGITRAQNELHLSTAQTRGFRGSIRMTVPSQFLQELPLAEMNVRDETFVVAPPSALTFDDTQHAQEDFETRVFTADTPRKSEPFAPDLDALRKRWSLTTAAALPSRENVHDAGRRMKEPKKPAKRRPSRTNRASRPTCSTTAWWSSTPSTASARSPPSAAPASAAWRP